MADTRAAANGIMPVIQPNRTATARSGPHNYLQRRKTLLKRPSILSATAIRQQRQPVFKKT
jgi:hypothetical protein